MTTHRPTETDHRLARQARRVAVVLMATMLLWMGAQVMGGKLGLPPALAFLLDFIALAAFLWSLVVTYQIWRRRRDS